MFGIKTSCAVNLEKVIMDRNNRIGSWTAVLIGTPIGLAFAFLAFFLSLFPPFDMILFATGGGLIWHPIVFALIIPMTFMTLLWLAGKKIKTYLDKDYSVIKTSFLFTININKWLFGLILILFLISGLFLTKPSIDRFTSVWVGVVFSIIIFLYSTIITTFTIGLLIVNIAKNKIYSARADL